MTKLGLSQERKDSLMSEKSVNVIHHIYKLQEKKHIIILTEAEKLLVKIYSFIIKNRKYK